MSPEKENKVYVVLFAILAVAFLVLSVVFLYSFVAGVPIVNISDIVVSLVAANLSAGMFYLSWTYGKALKKQKKRGG